MDSSVLLAIGGGAVAVLFAVVLTIYVLRQPPGNARMVEIASAIQEGASAYLNRQYLVIAVIGVVDLTRKARKIAESTYEPLPAFFTAVLVYGLVLFALVAAARLLERWLAGPRAS